MASTIQFKRRGTGGAAGAPASLKSGEVAYNMADNTVYIGYGDDGSGNATSVKPFGGQGAFADLTSAQTIAGAKTFSSVVSGVTPTDPGHLVTKAYADGLQISYSNGTGITKTGNVFAVDFAVVAPLASPALTGTPTAPTATSGTNTTQLATTAFVKSEINLLINGAGTALDTLNELAAALGNDPNFASTVSTSIATKLAKASNLSDLADAPTARTNLGLGTIATQAASNVNITGGTIGSGVTINATVDGGTF